MTLYNKGEIKKTVTINLLAIKAILIKQLNWPVCLPGGKIWDAAFKEQLLAEVCLLQGRGEINPLAQTYLWASGELTQLWPHESAFWCVVHDHMKIKIFKNNIWCWGCQSVCAQSLGCYAGAWFSSSRQLCDFEGMGQKWYGMLNNQNRTAAFESQEHKYVTILKSDFLLWDRVSTQSSGCRTVLFSVTIWLPGQWKAMVGAVYSPDIVWHLSEITKSRRKKKS